MYKKWGKQKCFPLFYFIQLLEFHFHRNEHCE